VGQASLRRKNPKPYFFGGEKKISGGAPSAQHIGRANQMEILEGSEAWGRRICVGKKASKTVASRGNEVQNPNGVVMGAKTLHVS